MVQMVPIDCILIVKMIVKFVQAENNKGFIIEMGQAQSVNNQDDNCFRACIKEKRTTNKKIQAAPHYPPKNMDPFPQEHQNTNQYSPDTPHHAEHHKKQKESIAAFETSLQQRLHTAQVGNRKKCMVQYSTDIMTVETKQQPLVEAHLDTSNEIILGLQSKFSGDKSQAYVRGIFPKTSVICIGGSPVTRGNSNQKEYGSQAQTTSKSNRTSFSTKSRNILLNKIESIKQKYYERQLQIEIYQDQREYQEQINQINQIQRTFTLDNSCLPQQSIGEIKAIRDKILKKLKDKKQGENILPPQDQSANIDKSLYDQLQLYSREARQNDQILNQSQKLKKSKRAKHNISSSGRLQLNKSLNRSLNGTLPQVSTDEKIEFSQYSEESLHQIRQLDEQYEEYKSKMSAMYKSTANNLKLPPSNLKLPPSNFPKGPSNQPSKVQRQQQQHQSPSHSKLPQPPRQQVQPSPSASKLKQQGVQYSKNNKILLF